MSKSGKGGADTKASHPDEVSAKDVELCARWLREAWSGLESRDGILFEKRVHYFLGVEMIDRLCSLSSVPAVVEARAKARDQRIEKEEFEAAERARKHAEAAEAARKKKDPAQMTEKERASEQRRTERLKREEKERAEEIAQRKAKRATINAAAKKKKTFQNAAIEKFIQSERDAMLLGSMMLRAEFFHRSQIAAPHSGSGSGSGSGSAEEEDGEDVRLEMHPRHKIKIFDEDGVYTWLIYPSQRKLWVQSALLAIFTVFCCCIKVWPLWLKIIVWWLSAIFLTIMLSIIAIRLVLFACMWIIGFRGLWLFPNLFNDDTDLLDAFSPLFGRGVSASIAHRAAANKKGGAAAAAAAAADDDAEDGYFQFGALNFVILVGLGVVGCYQMGLFQGENIPEFVISQHDLWKNYGHLLPPPTNRTDIPRYTAPSAAADDATTSDSPYTRDDSTPTAADAAEDVPLQDDQ